MLSLVLMKTYGGVFYSILTLPVYKDSVETLDDLERVALNGEYDIITFHNSYYYTLFTNAECCGAYYSIGEAIKSSSIAMPNTAEDGIISVNTKNAIFISSSIALSFGVRTYSSVEMHISSEALMIDQFAMALQKGSPLQKSMDNA